MSVAEPAVTGLETAAAERLYEQNSSRVLGYCLRMLGSREEAEDASQTTFMQAFRALRRGVVPVYETAWLLTIAKNVCLGRHRASGRRRAVELVRDPQDLDALAGRSEDESDALVGLQEALTRLPEMQRRAFLLREWQGRSYAEIAAELGVTVPAVEALICRARKALALELGGEERRRRHAFDIASLLAALKSLLGGGAAVKVAVGAATVVGIGAAAGGASEERAREPARSPAARVAPAPAVQAPVREASSVRAKQAPSARARASRRPAARPVRRKISQRPPAPRARPGAAEVSSPQPAPAAPTVAPAPQASAATPATPAVPVSPAKPETPVLPEVPGLPPLPEVPELPIPKVEVPPLPTDELPVEVPSLPELPEVPGLPDLPVLP